MQENLKDILSHLTTEVDQETLLLYLQGKLAPEKQHEVEKKLLDSKFEADAYEGMQDFGDQQKLLLLAEQLNLDLRKKTARKKALREKLRLKNEPWLYLALILLLLLVVVCYMVVYRFLHA